jgi:NADH-quinone oxidoreductase subunit H
VLRKVTLDMRPVLPQAAMEAREAEGQRALTFMGMHFLPGVNGAPGLRVESVEPGSEADRAGLLAGDVIAEAAGVRVFGSADVVPPPGARDLEVVVRRGSVELTKTVRLEGFKRSPPSELLEATLAIASALGFILLFAAPGGERHAWLLHYVAGRMRTRARRARGLRGALVAPIAVGIGISALLAVMPFGQYLVAPDLDLGVLYVVAITALAAVSIVETGPFASRAVSALATVVQKLPAGVALFGTVAASGSLRVGEMVRAQGGWPWSWAVFHDPGTCLLGIVCGLSLLSTPEGRAGRTGQATEGSPLAAVAEGVAPNGTEGAAIVSAFGAAMTRAHDVFFAAILAAVFLGGWELPGAPPVKLGGRLEFELLGASVFLAKTWALVAAVAVARNVLPRLGERARTVMALKWGVPCALLGGILAAAWVRVGVSPRVELLLGAGLFLLTGLVALALVQRVRFALAAATAETRVNPFL